MFTSTTIAGVPRVKQARKRKAKPLEPTVKRDLGKKKVKDKNTEPVDDITNAWRKR